MKKTLKIIAAMLIVLSMLSALTLTSFAWTYVGAYKTASGSKSTTEFGTLKGWQGGTYNDAGRKSSSFETTTTKKAPKILAEVEVLLWSTGDSVGGDTSGILTNTTWAGYYWESHTSKSTSNYVSIFGCHEARGQGSAVIYTTLVKV